MSAAKKGNGMTLARYYKPGQADPVKLFANNRYLGKVAHGGYLNVPSQLIGQPREDGSRFLTPEIFFQVDMPPDIPRDTFAVVEKILADKELS